MKHTELEIGDIIVFRRWYYPEGSKVNDEKQVVLNDQRVSSDALHLYDDHVAMYAGHNAEGHPTLLHSIDSGEPYKSSTYGLCSTLFRDLGLQSEPVDCENKEGPVVYYHVEYLAYRCKDSVLAQAAFQILNAQVPHLIPYDHNRLDKMLKKEQSLMANEDFLPLSLEAYQTEGRYRTIKFAARPEAWVRKRADGFGVTSVRSFSALRNCYLMSL